MTTEQGALDRSPASDAQPFLHVLREELRLIRLRRGRSASSAPDAARVMSEAQDVSAFGVAFSGGGIRSATFNLGVAQGLAERNLWPAAATSAHGCTE